jgi:hypothetical protein
MAARRIEPADARRHAEQGALLVCAYDDEAKCRGILLDGAITLKQLQAREKDLPKDKEIDFYCA